MDLASKRLYATRKLVLVFNEITALVTSNRPTIVKNDVVVSEITKTEINHVLRCGEQQALVHIAVEGVPVIPTHLGYQIQSIVT